MSLFVFGINHETAPVEVREQVAFAPESTPSALQQLLSCTAVQEAAILSTCNRTEVYGFLFQGDQAENASEPNAELLIQGWLQQYHQLAGQISQHYYCYYGADAAKHMMRVASGMDSLVLGEPQILGQLKSSYTVAREAGSLSSHLNRVFQQAFNTAKQVRSRTAIGESPVSVAFAAVTMARQIFADLSEQTALLIGAGETTELLARHLCDAGVNSLIVANRTLARAESLANEFGASAILLADVPEILHQADIVISSTASQLPILGKGVVERALKKRKHRLMFMIDIAVPRDIESEVDSLDDVYLYTVDNLKDVIEESIRSRQQAARAAEAIITEGVAEFLHNEKRLDAVATIREYRNKMTHIRDGEIERAIASLNKGHEPKDVLTRMARDLCNKMMHGPTVFLNQAQAEEQEQSLQAVQAMFDLDMHNLR